MKTFFLNESNLTRHRKVFLKFIMITAVLLYFGFDGYSQTDETCLMGKHIPRTAPNLLDAVHGQFTQAQSDWYHYEARCYNSGQYPLWSSDAGYDGNPGCLKLTGPDTNGQGCAGSNNDMVRLHNIPIQDDKTYTISVKCKAEDVCHSPVMLIQLQAYNPVTGSQTYPAGQRNYAFSTADADVWEEFSFSFKMPPGVTKMRIQLVNYRKETADDTDMVAYMDDLYLGEGVSFDDAPSCKTPFDGENVKVDELGNVYVKNDNDEWEWFFPFVIHGDGYRKINDPIYTENGWKRYSAQGFNAIIAGSANPTTLANGSYPTVDNAIDAGLKVVPHLGFYYAKKNNDGTYGAYTLDHLENCLNYINNNHSMNDLLAYFIDNEVYNRWEPMTATTNKVMEWESGVAGTDNRIAPIYMLNGTPGLGPKYLSYDEEGEKICHVGDITSSYISFDDANNQIATNWRLRNLDLQHNQKMPANIAQINGNRLFRARIYGSIASGARGMDYWRDFAPGHSSHIPNCYDNNGNPIPNCPDPNNPLHQNLFDDATDKDGDGATTGDILNNFLLSNGNLRPSNDITQVEWWDDFPNLVDEIYQMKDLIQQPHWTSTWGVSSCASGSSTCDDANFVIGTRELNNAGYIIVANYGTAPVTATIMTSGLPFANATLKDFFTDATITQMTNSQFQITLPYNGVGVYKIDEYIPTSSPTTCLDDITVSGNLSGLYEAAQTVTTNSTTSVLPTTNARLRGGFSVKLKHGFKALYGSKFKAHIAPCAGTTPCETCPGLPPFLNVTTPKKDESETWVKHYPNPFKAEVSFEFNLDEEADTEIIVSDVNGKTVATIPNQQMSRGIQTIQLSTKGWVSGVYFYQLNIKEQGTGITKHSNGTLIKM